TEKAIKDFSFGIGLSVSDLWDTVAHPEAGKIPDINLTEIPIIGDAIKGYLNSVVERAKEKLGHEPNQQEINLQKAEDDKLMGEVRLYEQFMQLNGKMTERGMDNWAVGELGGGYIALKAAMHATELGYSEIGHPIGEAVMPRMADMITAFMNPIEQGLVAIEKGIEIPAAALGVEINVPGVGGFTENVRKVIAGEVDLFFGIDSTEVVGEMLNPINFLFIIPFVGPGSKFVQAVKSGRYAYAAFVLVDEMVATGSTPEMVSGALGGMRSLMVRGLTETLMRSPGLKKNNIWQRWMINFGNRKTQEANANIEKGATKLIEDRNAIAGIYSTAVVDGKAWTDNALKPYSQDLIDQVRRHLDDKVDGLFVNPNFFNLRSLASGELGSAPIRNAGFLSRGMRQASTVRTEYTPLWHANQQVLRERRAYEEAGRAAGETAEEFSNMLFQEKLVSASGRKFSQDGVGRTGQVVKDKPLAHLSEAKVFGPEGKPGAAAEQIAQETGAAVNKINLAYLPKLNTGFKAFAEASVKKGVKIVKDSPEVLATIKSETEAIAKYTPSQLQTSRTDLEYATTKLVVEAAGNPTPEQAAHFETIVRQLDTVTTEMETRYGTRAWRRGLDNTDDAIATRKYYDDVAKVKTVEDSKLYQLTDDQANTRFVDLLIEAGYRAGHPAQKVDDVLRAREVWVHEELNAIAELLGQRGFKYSKEGTWTKGEIALGWSGKRTSSKVANQIEETVAGSEYAGKLAGDITTGTPAYLKELRETVLAARRTATGTVRKSFDNLLDDIANQLGSRRELDEASKSRKVVHEPIERGIIEERVGEDLVTEGAELPRMTDVDVSPDAIPVTIRNAGEGVSEDAQAVISKELTTITLESGLKILARVDPDTGGIWVKIINLRGGKKAIPLLEEGLNDLRNFAEDNNKVIRGWARPFGKGKARVDQDEIFDIYDRNGFLVERDRNSAIRPWKEFEYRPYIREGEVPDKKTFEVARSLDNHGDGSTSFIDVDEIVLPELPVHVVSPRMVTSRGPRLGKTANGVWEGTKEEAQRNLTRVQERLTGKPRSVSAFSGEYIGAEEGRELQRQIAKWQRIVDNNGEVNVRLEELWEYQNDLEIEMKTLKAKYWKEASPELDEQKKLNIINEFEDEAGEGVVDPALIGDKKTHATFLDDKKKLEEALEANWKAIKIADAGRTFTKQNVIATEFQMSVDAVNAARPQKEGGGYLLFVVGRKGKGGGDKITSVKTIEEVHARQKKVDDELQMLLDKEIPQGPNFARDTLTLKSQRDAWVEYKRQIDELVDLHVTEEVGKEGEILFKYRDTAFSDTVPKHDLDEAELYAQQYLIDPERGDIGSSSIQERTIVMDREYGGGITDLFNPLEINEAQSAFYDDVVAAMIKRAQEISANQKRKIYVHEIPSNESSTGAREISVFGVTAKGKQSIEEGIWEGKDVGLPKTVVEFINEIDGKIYKGKKKDFIDNIFRKNIVESGWNPEQRGRMQLLRNNAARLDALGARPSNVNQRFLYNRTYDDVIAGISHEVSNGLDDVPNRVGKQLEEMNIKVDTLPDENSLMNRDGTFVNLKGDDPSEAIAKAWDNMGMRNPDWPSIRDASLITKQEEQVGIVTEALRQTGWIVIKRNGKRSIRFEITGEITQEQAKGLRKIIDDGDYAIVDVVQADSYGQRSAKNSHLAKLKGETQLPKEVRGTAKTVEEYADMGIKPRSTSRAELDKKINDLIDLDTDSMKERLTKIGSAVDGAESSGTLPPNYSQNGNMEAQVQLTSNGPGRKFNGSTPIEDGTGIIFPDGTIWLDRPRRMPTEVKGKKPKETLVGTTKDGVRVAFGGSYDMTENEVDEFFIEFLNNTGGMRFKSSGGQVEIIVNRPPTKNQLISFGALQNPKHERRGYEITIKASDGQHTEKIVGPTLEYTTFDEAGQGLLEIEARVAREDDGWEVLRVYGRKRTEAAKDQAEIYKIDQARESGAIPKVGDNVDIEDSAHDVVAKGKLIGIKNKSITYKDGRGKELTADVYKTHKQGPQQRPIVKKPPEVDASPIMNEADEIAIAVREQDGKGYIVDNDGVEYGMGGKGDDIFTGRGMLRVYGPTGKQPPVLTKNVREILDSNRTVIWERQASEVVPTGTPPKSLSKEEIARRRAEMLKRGVDVPDDFSGEGVWPPPEVFDDMGDVVLQHRINTLMEEVAKVDKRTKKYQSQSGKLAEMLK
ncbi:MAG: hypothetical protein QQN63_03065, partial [Nitrosopumilus sp.]